jgi:hypothetical protein
MKGLLSKIEVIVIGLFVLIFLFWVISKCNSSREQLREEAATEAKEDSLANASKQPPPANTPQPATQPATPGGTTPVPASPATQTPAQGSSQPATQTTQPATPQELQLSRLFVTIDKLKLRKSPGLKGELLGELKLFDEVFYMNEVTDSTYEVNLGKEMANEPYVKIKTKKGTVGWVYGAGVHYVKKKRSGVLE